MNPRIENLLNRWIDGELSAPESEAVQHMLAEDAEVRRACYDLLMVDRLLDEHVEGRRDDLAVVSSIACESDHDHRRRFTRFVPLVAAALVVFSLLGLFFLREQSPRPVVQPGPIISGSKDSRITIAQRQDASQWSPSELLRLERGTADIKLNPYVSANLEGPAAVELVDDTGSVRLLEGIACFEVGAGPSSFHVHVPGGVLRDIDSRYVAEVLPDGVTNLRVESGFLEVQPREAGPAVFLKSGEALRLDPDGKNYSIRLPNHHFRSGLPQQLTLFRDDFAAKDNTSLVDHQPQHGLRWRVISEMNPTVICDQQLDTSSGARVLMANLIPHEAVGQRTVYIFSFDLQPPAWVHDKIMRQGGVEYINLVDAKGQVIVSITARASNNHRWQLIDNESKAVTALTSVCSLWTHSLTLCYGLDGVVTLHDGSSAQAPIIAEVHVASPPPISGILIGNLDGGDLAFSRIEAVLLPGPPLDLK